MKTLKFIGLAVLTIILCCISALCLIGVLCYYGELTALPWSFGVFASLVGAIYTIAVAETTIKKDK